MGKFILGDCMDPEMGLPSYPDKYFDFGVIDPPYGIDFQSSWRTENLRHKKIANDKTPYIEWIAALYPKMKDGSRIVSFYRWDVAHEFIQAFRAAGFTCVGEIVWDKVGHGMGDLSAGLAVQHETAIYCTKGRFEFERRPKSVYRTPKVYAEHMIHPNEKPRWLYEALISDFSRPGDVCVDPFAGSGVSLEVYEAKGFDCVGYEIDPDYYAAATKRMKAGIQKQLF